jgi:chemotaxis response regulator CheB
MTKIRVLVANRPRLMRDLITATIADQTDIEVVGEVQRDGEILETIELKQPDVLIIALGKPGQRSTVCEEVVRRYPHLRVVALDADRNVGFFYWAAFGIHASPIEVSEDGVLRALRGSSDWMGRKQ